MSGMFDKATPRPWAGCTVRGCSCGALWDAEGSPVGNMHNMEAATLVRRAVNSHVALIDALRQIVEATDAYDESESADDRCIRAIEKCRAALTSAAREGE